MLNNWFECKIAYQKVMENGLEKNATETYFFEALSFTEAEKRAIEYIRPFINGEFEVTAVGRKKYSEVFYNDSDAADLWFHAKVIFSRSTRRRARRRSLPHLCSCRLPTSAMLSSTSTSRCVAHWATTPLPR